MNEKLSNKDMERLKRIRKAVKMNIGDKKREDIVPEEALKIAKTPGDSVNASRLYGSARSVGYSPEKSDMLTKGLLKRIQKSKKSK